MTRAPEPGKGGAGEERWEDALALPPQALADTTLELHWAAQIVASAGQTFAEPRDDDSHRAMIWSPQLDAFVGVGFAGPYPFRLALRPRDLTLMLLDREDGALGVFELQGRSRAQAYEWLGVGMATYRGGNLPVIERPEYEMPDHPVGGDAAFSTRMEAELSALSALYASGAALLDDLFGPLEDASDVRCWPHHFDVATLITVKDAPDAEEARTVGVGLAPMGGGYGSWYLYVTPWPYPEANALPDLHSDGAWHTEGWTGAVLTGARVMALPRQERAQRIRHFVEEATDAARTALDESA
ncbi:MAG: hypothetical protein R3253_04590 [Longimicrobiales bacterium]|nr:hypothetical protein [Longimicrobiales bacterium]